MATITYFKLVGKTPLLLHNSQTADPSNEYARALRDITDGHRGGKKMSDDTLEEKKWLQFQGALYWDKEVGLHLPGYNVFRSFVDGGRLSRQGTNIERATLENSEICGIDPWTDKFDTPREAFDAGHTWTVPVKIGTSLVMSTRPYFPEWEILFSATVDEDIINVGDYHRCAVAAGKYVGVGDGRLKGYGKGRYDVELLGTKQAEI